MTAFKVQTPPAVHFGEMPKNVPHSRRGVVDVEGWTKSEKKASVICGNAKKLSLTLQNFDKCNHFQKSF